MSAKENIAPAVELTINPSGDYAVQTLAQLYYAIDKAPPVNEYYNKLSWNMLDSVTIDGAKIFKAETKLIAFVSSQFLNRGYRILAERQSDQTRVLLCEGENTNTGKQKVEKYWEDIQAALERSSIIHRMEVLDNREMGCFQEPTAVVTSLDKLEGQPCAEFYQTIYYGTVRKKGTQNSVATFYSNDADKFPSLHVGIAQCSIPYQKFMCKGDLPRESGFVYKLFTGDKKKMIPMRINYINEMEMEDFKRSLAEKSNDCYASYLRYLHSSMDNLADTVCKEEDSIAIKKALVEDLTAKFFGANDEEHLRALKVKVDQLNKDEKEYLEVLNQFEERLRCPPKNQHEDTLLYIHGFNNSVEECLLRAAQIACDIGFGGKVAVYSWPSLESPLRYFQDKEQIDVAMRRFIEFLVLLCQSARKVHIIAHSAANLLFTRSALAAGSILSQGKGKIGQLICAHADVKVELFREVFRDSEVVPGIESIVDNVTVYYHPRDKALWWADAILSTGEKIGRQSNRQLPNEKKLDNINIGEIATTKETLLCMFSNLPLIKHNVYAENPTVLQDMSEIINGGLKAYQRKHINIACACRMVKARNIEKLPECPLCGVRFEYVLDSFIL